MKRRQQGILTGMPFMANLAPRTFVDDLGRKLYLAKPPARIVSLAPSITEMLFALELRDEIVGVTQFCDYPEAALTKPKIGASFPNVEAIVAQRPDLVVGQQGFIRADVLSKLEQLKIPTFIMNAKTVEDILSHIQTMGRIVSRDAAASDLVAKLRQRIAAVKERLNGVPRLRVLYVLNSEPLITVGPGSFIHQVLELAGGINIAAASVLPYPRYNMEAVLKDDPEVLVFPIGTDEGIPESEQARWRQWTSLSAVKQNRYVKIPSVLLDRQGPRIVEGLEWLAGGLHPQRFPGKSGAS
jgi:iron complex transport system substrate-binding protein